MSVLLVLSTTRHLETTLTLAHHLARAKQQPLRVVVPSAEGSFGTKTVFVRDDAFSPDTEAGREIQRAIRDGQVEDIELVEARIPPKPTTATRFLEGLKPSLMILPHLPDHSEALIPRTVGSHLFDHARVSVLLVRPGERGLERCERILVPAAGGRHSILALQLAEGLLQQGATGLMPFYVEPDVGEYSEEVGLAVLRRTMNKAGISEGEHITPRVRLRDSFERGLAREAEEGNYDLVVVGASDSGRIRRYLFGSIPDRLLRGHNSLTIAVVRAADPALHRLRSRLEQGLDLVIPQLQRPDRVALFDVLQRQSRWNFDFFALIALSTGIASFGLVQSSTAVVIGAMLVAPLMSPLLGVGLSLVQGNLPLALRSMKSVFYGFFLALLISLVVGVLSPLRALNPELLARCSPTLLDLGVALLSGIAAAYCTARPRLSAALPGVAIAAALVPPIATTGISLAIGDPAHALGAATLFGTNVVTIVLGASVAFYLAGIRGNRQTPRRHRWAIGSLILLLIGALGLSLPLGSSLYQQFATHSWGQVTLSRSTASDLAGYLEAEWDCRLVSSRIQTRDSRIEVVLVVERNSVMPQDGVQAVANFLRQRTGSAVTCRIQTLLLQEADSSPMKALQLNTR